MTKIKDTAIITLIAGGIATIIQTIISWFLFLLNITEQTPAIFHARLITNKFDYNIYELLLGFFTSFAAGIFFAGFVVLLLKITGKDFAILKGAFIGFINAMIQFLFFARLFIRPEKVIPSYAGLWHVFILYTLWGVIVAYIIEKYYDIKIINM